MGNRPKFQAINGTRDLLPPETDLWNRVEQTARDVFGTFGFGEIRVPIFEPTELFARSIGLDTDVVSKEMYSFQDRGDSSISLRPEATASVCRAYIEHNMHALPQPVKLFYYGPMFRRERPQKGRYRQFYQVGAEVLEALQPGQQDSAKSTGKDAAVDAELIEMVMAYFAKLELEGVRLEINSIGCRDCRPNYVEALRARLLEVRDQLGADSQRRIETNPLRVLDSKLESEQEIIARLPRIGDYLCEACAKQYAEVKRQLAVREVPFTENWRLVRGLDYYMRTTFEITARGLGSQNAVCGGGRYDGLVEVLGGMPTKGIGFAIGEDRLILILQEQAAREAAAAKESGIAQPASEMGIPNSTPKLDAYIAPMGIERNAAALALARELRRAGLSVEVGDGTFRLKKSFEAADKVARHIVILGEDEVLTGTATVKTFATGQQQKVERNSLVAYLN